MARVLLAYDRENGIAHNDESPASRLGGGQWFWQAVRPSVWRPECHRRAKHTNGGGTVEIFRNSLSPMVALAIIAVFDTFLFQIRRGDRGRKRDDDRGLVPEGPAWRQGEESQAGQITLEDGSSHPISRVVNVLGDSCPRPQLMTKKALNEAVSGAIIEIKVDNSTSMEILPTMMAVVHGTHITTLKADRCWRVFVRKN